MTFKTTFTSDKTYLNTILNDIWKGKIQLPDFQRGWVWDNDHIVNLLASISLAYPIGAIMFLENGNPEVRFKPKPFEGVELTTPTEPEIFVLDGQQRLTSLFLSLLCNQPVKTIDRNRKEIRRWYYIDMIKALDPNEEREDCIISISDDKKTRSFRGEVEQDLSLPEYEYEKFCFPLVSIFDSAAWRREYNKYWQHNDEKINLFDRFEAEVVENFKQYLIPFIQLLKSTPKIAVCQVFEKVNQGGIRLNEFEILTATFAADNFNLREDWEGPRDEMGKKIGKGRRDIIKESSPVLHGVSEMDFLKTVTLLTTYERKQLDQSAGVSCKKEPMLKLSVSDYQKWARPATEGYKDAAKFLLEEKVFTSKDLPYSTQLIPLATIFSVLKDRGMNAAVRQKLKRWYWCGVFGELYGGSVESRLANDIVEVLRWLEGGDEPTTIRDCNFAPSRLYTLKSRVSAAYKGLFVLLMRDGCKDFISGVPVDVQNYFEDRIDIHHIFPRDYCSKSSLPEDKCESMVNKAPLSKKTNITISGNAPSIYLENIKDKKHIDDTSLDDFLRSHLIDPASIRSDDFELFFSKRMESMLQRIEAATGKAIPRQTEQSLQETLKADVYLEIEEEISENT